MNDENIASRPITKSLLDSSPDIELNGAYYILFIDVRNSSRQPPFFSSQHYEVSNSFEEAAYRLQCLLGESARLPDVIVGQYGDDHSTSLADFASFISKNIELSSIPFVLMAGNQSRPAGAAYPRLPNIDDIIAEEIPSREFFDRILLLRKFKSLKQRQTLLSLSVKEPISEDRKILHRIDIFFKRVIDVLISSISLLIFLPFFVVIGILIKIDSKGPIFYTSYRAGFNYCIFKFLKFRTMVSNADHNLSNLMDKNQYNTVDKDSPAFFKISNDPRITRFGKFLRNTSLDELPQLVNVLKGDMSLVGNRPLPLYEAKTLTTDTHAERFNAPAGITGLWQISKRGQREMSAEERIALDILYARNNSLVNDLQIMMKTPMALIQKENV